MATRRLALMAALLGAVATPHAMAQVPPGMPKPPGMNLPTDPKMLPGDWVLPPGFHFPPMPPGMKMPPVPANTAPAPSLKLALKAAEAALAACKKAGVNIGVAVIDSSGQPRIGLSEDGATGGHIYTAVRKALAAIAFDMPSSAVAAKLQTDPAAASQVTPNMAPMAGAVPLFSHGKLIGAIGASGASSEQDEKCAAAGAAVLR